MAENRDERLRKEVEAMNRIGAAAGSAMEVASLCALAGRCLVDLFGAGIVFVALYEAEEGLISTPFFSKDGVETSFPPFPYGEGLTSRVIESRKPLLLSNAAEVETFASVLVLRASRPSRSWLGVPMIVGPEVVGVLSVQDFDHEGAFSSDDVDLLSSIAGTLGSRVQSARLFEAVNRRALEAAAVAETGRWISESLDLETVLGRLAERAADLLTRNTAAVFLLEEGMLRAVAAHGPIAPEVRAQSFPVNEGILGRVVRTGIPEIVDDTLADPDSVRVEGSPPDEAGEKLMVAPLFSGEEVLGAMVIWRDAREARFRRSDLDFLSSLARQAEVAIHNARLHRGVVEEARRSASLYDLARRARVEAEEASRLKSGFLAAMSHELRTPLNAVINFAYLLKAGTEGPLSEGQEDLIGRIEAAGNQLLGLINDVLDLSKIESGLMELRLQQVDAHDLGRSVLATTAGLLRGRPVDLVADLDPAVPPFRADLGRVRQVLLNLLSNAAKFTEVGHIILRARRSGTAGEEILFEVEDSGIGMDPDDIPRAFAEFVQLDNPASRVAGGTGLGLPLARKFVELHGGRIWASSMPGEGSVFAFALPLGGPSGPEARP